MAASKAAAKAAARKAEAEAAAQLEKQLALATECAKAEAQVRAEEHLFNLYQQQKDKVNHFWVVAKKQLEEERARLRNLDREIQDLEEKHGVEVKIYKQRVKHLLYEHQNESTGKRTEAQVALKLKEDEQRDEELELQKDKRALERVRKEAAVRHEEYLKELKRQHDRDITMLRLEFERESRDLCSQYEDSLERTRKELTEQRMDDVRRIEARKSKHIAALIEAHDKAFQDIKAYFSEITHANLDLIRSLKDEVNTLATREAADEKRIIAIAQENKRMSAPLARALEESGRLKAEKATYLKEMELLNKLKARVLIQEDAMATLQWEAEVIEQRLARIQKERDDLYSRFTSALYDVQQKAGFRNLLLEKKLEAAAEEVEKKGAALGEVLAAAQLDPTVLGAVESRLEDVVASKDALIAELKAELQRIVAAHNRVIDAYGAKMAKYGVPQEELGFEPMRLAAVQAAEPGAVTVSAVPPPARTPSSSAAAPSAPGSRGGSRAFSKAAAATFSAAPLASTGGRGGWPEGKVAAAAAGGGGGGGGPQ